MADKLELKFSKKVYPQKIIKQAIKDFGRAAEFSTNSEGNYTCVTAEGFDADIRDELEGEFCNYVFSLAKKNLVF